MVADSQDRLTIAGRAFPARSSREVPVTLEIAENVARLLSGDGAAIAEAEARALKWDMPVGRAPRRAHFPDGTMFETPEIERIDRLRASSAWTRLHRAERFGRPLLFMAFAAATGAFLVWRFALPAIVGVAVALTPPSLRDLIDDGSMHSLDRTLAKPSTLDTEDRARVEAVFASLLAALPPEDAARHFTLHFRSTPAIGPNAFALPGGTVVVTDQLVQEFGDPDILAGVLGHEIGHVTGDHGLRQLYRSVGFYVLVALIAGDTGPILEDVLFEGGAIVSLSFSRKHEAAADAFGLRLAEDSGHDPAGLLTFFESLPDSKETRSGWLASHPASGARIEAIRDYLSQR